MVTLVDHLSSISPYGETGGVSFVDHCRGVSFLYGGSGGISLTDHSQGASHLYGEGGGVSFIDHC